MRASAFPATVMLLLVLYSAPVCAGTGRVVVTRASPLLLNPDTALTDYVYAFFGDFADHERMLRDIPGAEGPCRIRDGLSRIRAYDTLPAAGTDRREGDLDMPAIGTVHVVREKDGDIVRFIETGRIDRTETPQDMELVLTLAGTLSLSDETLLLVTRIELDGKLTWKTVFELVRLPGGVWLAQFLLAVDPAVTGGPEGEVWLSGCFFRFDRTGYRRVEVNNPSPLDFSPLPLRGRGDISPDAMARDYGIVNAVTIADGIVTME